MVPQQHRRRRRRAVLGRTAERRIVVIRGEEGFGFTIAGQRPCVVSAVATAGPAERAGLRAGDSILAVDGASVTRASHSAVARLVAAAPQAISLSVAPREAQPTDTEDTEPEERARTRRRHPPMRKKLPQPSLLHHPGCHAQPSTSGVNDLFQNFNRAHLSPTNHIARLECRAVIGYLGTIETPRATSETPPASVKTAVRRLRQEKRPSTLVLLSVLPNILLLRRNTGQTVAQYARERILYAGSSSDVERRYFGLVIAAADSTDECEVSHSCHVFAIDPRMVQHDAHANKARDFHITCSRDPVAERCLEFPPSAEYVVGIIRGMYSLPSEECSSPALLEISKLAIKGDSPAGANFSRCNRALRHPRLGRRNGVEDNREGPDFVANSPQPSNHSEITTTSSNSDSGIGFHNDGRNVADRILVVDFAGQPPINRCRVDVPRRPLGLVGINGFEEGPLLSNTTPVVDGFAGQGRPLNHLEDVIPNVSDFTHRRVQSLDSNSDSYNYNNYVNVPSTSRMSYGIYDPVYTENECHYEHIPPKDDFAESVNSIEIYEERKVHGEQNIAANCDKEFVDQNTANVNCNSIDGHKLYHNQGAEYYEKVEHEKAYYDDQAADYSEKREYDDRKVPESSNDTCSVDNMTVVSGTASKASVDSLSVYSTRSHEEARPTRRKHIQASLDDMLVIGMREDEKKRDDDNFVHPSTVKFKVRKPKLNLLSKTKNMLTGRLDKQKKLEASRNRTLSASAGDVCSAVEAAAATAASEPDLRETLQAEQSSPFRRWTTGSGAGSSYRHHDHRSLFNKQMSEGTTDTSVGGGGVARWSLGLEQLLADAAGAAAFAHFLHNEFAAENIRFWWSCEQYAHATAEERPALAQQIYQRHLAENASEPVNVDAAARRAAKLGLTETPPPSDLFAQAQKQIFNVMKFDSYPRFLRSSVHAECARADLCGQPLPYGNDTERTKVKKSASNASERRRSGGGSLLPWRMRAASRDRSTNGNSGNTLGNNGNTLGNSGNTYGNSGNLNGTGNGNISSLAAPVVDVLENTSCSLCRIVLPDSATTVVGVDASVTVQALVERLLMRRNLVCNNYDVTTTGSNGENIVVDKSAPSTVLGGKEARIERRCVIVVELCGRCVSVRCGARRSLRAALRPVLQRYCAGTPTAHLQPHAHCSLDTTVQELDGQRIKITFSEEGDTSPTSSVGTVSQQEEDTYSNNSTQRAETRVRAALKPGAALHHAPPEFLENLRETQRQRLTRNDANQTSHNVTLLPPIHAQSVQQNNPSQNYPARSMPAQIYSEQNYQNAAAQSFHNTSNIGMVQAQNPTVNVSKTCQTLPQRSSEITSQNNTSLNMASHNIMSTNMASRAPPPLPPKPRVTPAVL